MDKTRAGFGDELRRIIRAEFRSQHNFAQVVNLSPGRISQLVQGEPTLTYESLTVLVNSIKSRVERERLYRAWQEAYAPSPFRSETFENNAQAASLAAETPVLLADGLGPELYVRLRKLWYTPALQDNDVETRFAIGRAFAEVCFSLRKRPEGASVTDALAELAQPSREPRLFATALWLRCVATRDGYGAKQALARFGAAQNFLNQWHPTSAAGLEARTELQHTLIRDRAVFTWHDYRHSHGDPLHLVSAAHDLEKVIEREPDHAAAAVDLEVLARCHSQLGNTSEARIALSRAKSEAVVKHPIHAIKVELTELRLLKGCDKEVIMEGIETLRTKCHNRHLVHYGREVDRALVYEV